MTTPARPPRRRSAHVLTISALPPSTVDRDLVNRISTRTGATTSMVLAVLLAALEEVGQPL
jgi:hypothetical protein